MRKSQNNYAFIDSQNLNLGIKSLGWRLDYLRFRRYLLEKYAVRRAYLFIGYLPQNTSLYDELRKAGYVLVLKPTIPDGEGRVKGNVDTDLVLQAVLDKETYDGAVIISSDGDFYSLVRYLYTHHKLVSVLSPHVRTCSILLKREAREKISFIDTLRNKLERK